MSKVEKELEILREIACLLSDAKLAEVNSGFAHAMDVDPVKNRKLADDLVDRWELML
jgi:hypothetical protein